MTYTGHVKNGVIVLDDADAKLSEGQQVQIVLAQASSEARPTLSERFKDFIGKADGLPADFAENHDHYIHGTPKNE